MSRPALARIASASARAAAWCDWPPMTTNSIVPSGGSASRGSTRRDPADQAGRMRSEAEPGHRRRAQTREAAAGAGDAPGAARPLQRLDRMDPRDARRRIKHERDDRLLGGRAPGLPAQTSRSCQATSPRASPLRRLAKIRSSCPRHIARRAGRSAHSQLQIDRMVLHGEGRQDLRQSRIGVLGNPGAGAARAGSSRRDSALDPLPRLQRLPRKGQDRVSIRRRRTPWVSRSAGAGPAASPAARHAG